MPKARPFHLAPVLKGKGPPEEEEEGEQEEEEERNSLNIQKPIWKETQSRQAKTLVEITLNK